MKRLCFIKLISVVVLLNLFLSKSYAQDTEIIWFLGVETNYNYFDSNFDGTKIGYERKFLGGSIYFLPKINPTVGLGINLEWFNPNTKFGLGTNFRYMKSLSSISPLFMNDPHLRFLNPEPIIPEIINMVFVGNFYYIIPIKKPIRFELMPLLGFSYESLNMKNVKWNVVKIIERPNGETYLEINVKGNKSLNAGGINAGLRLRLYLSSKWQIYGGYEFPLFLRVSDSVRVINPDGTESDMKTFGHSILSLGIQLLF